MDLEEWHFFPVMDDVIALGTSEVDKFQQEVIKIYDLFMRSWTNLQFPQSWEHATEWEGHQWMHFVPNIACLVFFCVLPFATLLQTRQKQPTYWITRELMIRLIGIIYFSAFVTLAFQIRPLYGEYGIFPSIHPDMATRPVPVFTFLASYGIPFSDLLLEMLSWFGVMLSLLMVIGVVRSVLIPLGLWFTYLSIVNLGTNLMNYGWEWLTLEIGFLAIFLMPLASTKSQPQDTPPSTIVIWLFRWMGFRLLFGAGMSKTGKNASACWHTLSCTSTHYFTQPMPSVLAWFAFHAPDPVHRLEVILTLFEQLVLPFGFLLPIRSVRIAAGVLEIFLQLCILATGNYAWINLTGILPCLALLDDEFLSNFSISPSDSLPANQSPTTTPVAKPIKRGKNSNAQKADSVPSRPVHVRIYRAVRVIIYILLLCFIVSKSTAPVQELFSDSPWLHFYDDYFFVTAQGLFGFINQYRVQIVLEYTHDDHSNWNTPPAGCADAKVTGLSSGSHALSCAELSDFCTHPRYGTQIRNKCPRTCGMCSPAIPPHTNWTTLDFKNLPGSLDRAPAYNSPVHYRFDWEVWIHVTARMEHVKDSALAVPGFIRTMISKVLSGDTDAISLMGTPHSELVDPAKGGAPKAIKANFYLYEFTSPSERTSTGNWWKREPLPASKTHVYTQALDGLDAPVHHSDPLRCWKLFVSVVVFVFSLYVIIHHAYTIVGPLSILFSAYLFYQGMASEYQLPSYYALSDIEIFTTGIFLVVVTLVSTRSHRIESTSGIAGFVLSGTWCLMVHLFVGAHVINTLQSFASATPLLQ